jgi:hypothetical protein
LFTSICLALFMLNSCTNNNYKPIRDYNLESTKDSLSVIVDTNYFHSNSEDIY